MEPPPHVVVALHGAPLTASLMAGTAYIAGRAWNIDGAMLIVGGIGTLGCLVQIGLYLFTGFFLHKDVNTSAAVSMGTIRHRSQNPGSFVFQILMLLLLPVLGVAAYLVLETL